MTTQATGGAPIILGCTTPYVRVMHLGSCRAAWLNLGLTSMSTLWFELVVGVVEQH